ncbi:GMC family oxidoreductase [Myxococcota bacterium]|nr:GMC family oxidoreductase [Myxococcota bacterium]
MFVENLLRRSHLLSARPGLDDGADEELWDVAVVGTGIGGATLGYELARRGRRVVFLERGRAFDDAPDVVRGVPVPSDADEELRLRHGRWPRPLHRTHPRGERCAHHPIGAGSGGTSLVFGMMMDRLRPCDLEPHATFSRADLEGSSAARWPIEWDELARWYERAEALYRVQGTDDPLSGTRTSLLPPPSPSEKERAFTAALEAQGLHPYRMHSACDASPSCTHCPSRVCPVDCRNDALKICLRPALAVHEAHLVPDCRVVRFTGDRRRVTAAICERHGRALRVRAKIFVVAAGAYATPALLLRSVSADWPDGLANESGLVGRNLMLHTSDFLAVSLRGDVRGSLTHGVAFNDLYTSGGTKLGNVHAHPFSVTPDVVRYYLDGLVESLPPLARRFVGRGVPMAARIGGWLERGGIPLATIVEDLPFVGNQLRPKPGTDEDVVYTYDYPARLRARNDALIAALKQRLGDALTIHGVAREDNLNRGHVSGTCRFGDDPRTSVVDPSGRAHGLDNLYVSDASLFPTSGGMSPSLTIAALALRVAAAIDTRA